MTAMDDPKPQPLDYARPQSARSWWWWMNCPLKPVLIFAIIQGLWFPPALICAAFMLQDGLPKHPLHDLFILSIPLAPSLAAVAFGIGDGRALYRREKSFRDCKPWVFSMVLVALCVAAVFFIWIINDLIYMNVPDRVIDL